MKSVLLQPTSQTIIVDTDIQYVLDINKACEAHIVFVLAKEGVSAEILGLYNLTQDIPINIIIETVHSVPNTTCTTEVKGCLYDNAVSSFEGRIIIKKEAQQTASYLEHNVLVLGQNTKNESRPVLQIDANDVKASHGATTGRIDPLQLFYLQSRGMSPDEAGKTIVAGFFNSILSRILDDTIREKIQTNIKIEKLL